MPAERVSMRRVREILRLKHECGATDRAIARSLGIARSTVAATLDRLAAAELRWPLAATLSERVLEAMLYAGPGPQRGSRHVVDEIVNAELALGQIHVARVLPIGHIDVMVGE